MWRDLARCQGLPSDWWETGDGGNRLALLMCQGCPVRLVCADPDSGDEWLPGERGVAIRHAGVIRAGTAYDGLGRPVPLCGCGYPLLRRSAATECRRCDPPAPRWWSQQARRRAQDARRRAKRRAA